MTPRAHVRGPYEPGTAGDAGFQLAVHGCTVADLIALAAQRNVRAGHLLSDVTRGTRRTRTHWARLQAAGWAEVRGFGKSAWMANHPKWM